MAKTRDYVISRLKDCYVNDYDLLKLINYLNSKYQQYDSLSDLERATIFWKRQLHGNGLITTRQHQDCCFAFLVPVHNESVKRILKQIQSIEQQTGLTPQEYEIIYVVNNDVADFYQNSSGIQQCNQEVVNAIRALHKENIHVIDKSSFGNEIKNCNIGKVRNLLLAEGSYRFFQNQKNGILIQLDADTYLYDKSYMNTLSNHLARNSNVIGIAGGITFEFSLDAADTEEIGEIRNKLKQLVLLNKWNTLVMFYQGSSRYKENFKKAFLGAHMITRSFETAVVGGVIEENALEDGLFGIEMEAYARERMKQVIELKDSLLAVSALRESNRTNVSFGADLKQMDNSQKIFVDNPLITSAISRIQRKFLPMINEPELNIAKLRSEIRTEKKSLMLSDEHIEHLITNIFDSRSRGLTVGIDDDAFRTIVNNLNCKVELNKDSYLHFERIVGRSAIGKRLIRYLDLVTEKLDSAFN